MNLTNHSVLDDCVNDRQDELLELRQDLQFAFHDAEDAVDRAEETDGGDGLVVLGLAVLFLLFAGLGHVEERLGLEIVVAP